MTHFPGRVVITGASSGIGAAAMLAFTSKGAPLALGGGGNCRAMLRRGRE